MRPTRQNIAVEWVAAVMFRERVPSDRRRFRRCPECRDHDAARGRTASGPPIATPAGAEHHPGKPIFAELITPDLAAAQQYYAGLYGWTIHDVGGPRSPNAEAYLDGDAVAGLVEKAVAAGENRQPA